MAFSSSWQRPRRELPSYRAFLRCFRAFRARWPRVVDFNPWNEGNHWYQPTYRHPRRTAGFYNAARRACPRCNVAAGDLLDSGNLARWLARYRPHLRGRPRLWSLHNYLDVNYLRPWRRSGTRGMLRLTRSRLWISETAGIVYYLRAGRLGERHAANATRWMLACPPARAASRGSTPPSGRPPVTPTSGTPRGSAPTAPRGPPSACWSRS